MIGKECYREINENLNAQLKDKKMLIAVHRGSWGGNIIENTVAAYDLCRQMGADLFECDLSMTTDGVLYAFHDGGEPRVLGVDRNILTMSSQDVDSMVCLNCLGEPSMRRLERFETVLEHFHNGELINVDRSWEYLPQTIAMMNQYPHAIRQAIVKTPVKQKYLDFFRNCPEKYMYMPIAKTMEEIKLVLSYPEINTVGVELIANTPSDELFQKENIQWLHEQGLFLWVNSITLGGRAEHVLFGGLDDDTAVVNDPDLSWGILLDEGIDVIQTDWPMQLHAYRERKLGKQQL